MEQWLVYKHTSTISGKSYVGLTGRSVKERWNEHVYSSLKESSFHFHRAIRLYGDQAWTTKVLADSIPSLEEAKVLERHYIRKYDTFENGYNMTTGGDANEAKVVRTITNSFYNPELDILELDVKVLDFVEKYELNNRTVYELVKGAHKSVHGWYLWVGPEGKYYRSNTYKFVHEVYGIKEYTAGALALAYELHAANVYKVVKGERTTTGGWSLYKEEK